MAARRAVFLRALVANDALSFFLDDLALTAELPLCVNKACRGLDKACLGLDEARIDHFKFGLLRLPA